MAMRVRLTRKARHGRERTMMNRVRSPLAASSNAPASSCGCAREGIRTFEFSAEDEARVNEPLQGIVAGTGDLLAAPELAPALRAWLKMIGEALGAASALYYDLVSHDGTRVPTLSCLAEWSRHANGKPARALVSFATPHLVDPYGAEAVHAASARGEVVAFHLDDVSESMREAMVAQGHVTTIVAPIVAAPRWSGVVSFGYRERHELRPRDEAILRSAADALAAVLERDEAEAARLRAESERVHTLVQTNAELARRRDLLDAVVAISSELLGAIALQEKAQDVVGRLLRALYADRCAIAVLQPPDAGSARGYLRFEWEAVVEGVDRLTEDPARRTFALSDCADLEAKLRADRPAQLVCAALAGDTASTAQTAIGAQSRFQYPILVDGALWGTIGADDCHAPRRWNDAEISTLRLVASAIASVVSRERLIAARIEAERLSAAELHALGELRESIVAATGELIEADSFAVGLARWLQTLARRMGAMRAAAYDSVAGPDGEPAAPHFLAEWAEASAPPSTRG
jgi:GAF domain-containing protein